MGARHPSGPTQAIAGEAARLIAEGQCTDMRAACRKAADKLGITNPRAWPDAPIVEAALREYQSLFLSDTQPAELEKLARLALEAMHDLRDFRPRLIGAVAKGLADRHSPIQLLLTADTPEQVIMALEDRRIPWRDDEVTLQLSRNRKTTRPAFRFQAGDARVELIVLSPDDRNDPPREPDTDQPLKGLTAEALEKRLEV